MIQTCLFDLHPWGRAIPVRPQKAVKRNLVVHSAATDVHWGATDGILVGPSLGRLYILS
jgi:hypothetical protein